MVRKPVLAPELEPALWVHFRTALGLMSQRETFRDWALVQGLGLRSWKRREGKRMAYCGT